MIKNLYNRKPYNDFTFSDLKIGDRVRIKSIDWYHQNCDSCGMIECISTGGEKSIFVSDMNILCGNTCTITELIYECQGVRLYEDAIGFIYPLSSIECIVN